MAEPDDDVTAPRQVGRPLDVEADARIQHAALELYGSRGWHGYNLNRVSAEARVGKALLYSRWRTKEDLLVDAFQALAEPPAPDLAVDLRTLLVGEALARLLSYTGPFGAAILRLTAESRALDDPTLTAVHERVFRTPSARLVAEVRRRRDDGELDADASATRLLDAIEGSVYIHTILTPADRLEALRAHGRQYVEQVVDTQLRALGYRPRTR